MSTVPYWWRDRLFREIVRLWSCTTAFLQSRGITFGKTVPHKKFDDQIYNIVESTWWENWDPSEGPQPAPLELRRLMMVDDKDSFWNDLRVKWQTLSAQRKNGFEFDDVSTLTLALIFWRIVRTGQKHVDKAMVKPRGWAWYWTYKELQGFLSDAVEEFTAAEAPERGVLRLDFPEALPAADNEPANHEVVMEACLIWVYRTAKERKIADAEYFPAIFEGSREGKSKSAIAQEVGISVYRVERAQNQLALLIKEYFFNNGDN
jgi:hypothetical protein